MDVYDKIRAGHYENKVPYDYVMVPVDENTMTVTRAREHVEEQKRLRDEQRDRHRAEEWRLREVIKADLEAEYGLAGHPKADKLWGLAWDRGHSSGFTQISCEYSELAELLVP